MSARAGADSATGRPSGTVTFLFTDVEGSTRSWDRDASTMDAALRLHDAVVRAAVEGCHGYVFATGGDSFAVAFTAAGDAIAAAVDVQRGLAAAAWPSDGALRVRMGLHTGRASERGGDYFGSAVNRAARLMSVAHGGQIVCSRVTAELAGPDLAPGVQVVPVGELRLADVLEPVSACCIVAEGLDMDL